ncbi:hypothetical protein ACET3X_008648 [Alternaria dauci]|uniref:Uncharacterized protein n=1 Tax=Alternaria dauci TaxID=48095 RepID=A0ABR3UAZ4_9PLEO
MALSSDEATHPDVTTLSDTETTAPSTLLPERELSNQGDAPGPDHPLAVSEDSVPGPENSSEVKEVDRVQDSADVEETTLGSPFSPPKLVTLDCGSIALLDKGEIMEGMHSSSTVASPGLVQGHDEQSNGKADSELASPIAKNDSPTASTLEAQAETVEVDTETANSDIKPDIDMTIESSKPFKPAHSLPPHMRPDFQSPLSRHFGVHDSRPMVPPNEVTRFNEGPRAPRSHYTSYQPRGDHVDREQFARISAQLMKTKHELDVEREKNRRLRTTIEAEQQQKVEAASSSMLSNLLREQAEALTLKAKVEARERELDTREQKISQHEMYLSEGQKQLWYSLEKQGVRPMSAVDMQRARQEAELNAQKTMADVNGKLNIKFEGLRLREAAQQMREQQYKAIIHDSLKSELENSLTDEKAEEIAELEYNNGYGAGKEIGRKEGHEKSRQRGFLEGYGACHRAQVTLSKFRQGLIDRNSPELDFLYDASHPHNLWNIGELVGRLQHEDDVERMKNVEKKEVTTEKKSIINARADNVADETRNVDGKVNGYTNGTMVHKREEPFSRMPPARPTFAAELRGPSATHNGQIILANSAASPVVKETERPIIKNEEPVANLIDFI